MCNSFLLNTSVVYNQAVNHSSLQSFVDIITHTERDDWFSFNLTFERCTSPSSSSPPTPRILRLFRRLIKSVWLCFFISGGWGLDAMVQTWHKRGETEKRHCWESKINNKQATIMILKKKRETFQFLEAIYTEKHRWSFFSSVFHQVSLRYLPIYR